MEQVLLDASRRDTTGKGAARQMRRDGLIPGVVYGMGQPATSLVVAREAVDRALSHHRGGNVLFDLRLEGQQIEANTAALIKTIQRHPISRAPESIDFQWVSLTDRVTVSVPVFVVGMLPDASKGAVVDQLLHEVEISCLPLMIPERVTISIDGLAMHETRSVAMLEVPDGVEILTSADDPVITCTPPTRAEEPAEGEAVEGELGELEEEG